MPWETYTPLPPAPPPDLPWEQWAGAGAALALCMAAGVLLARHRVRKRPRPAMEPDPGQRALRALAAIPADWPVDRSASAGARVLRAYLGAVGMGPGLAHPARSFSGLRAAESWRGLTDLLEDMESLACRPHPPRADWEQTRDLAARLLAAPPAPVQKGGAP